MFFVLQAPGSCPTCLTKGLKWSCRQEVAPCFSDEAAVVVVLLLLLFVFVF